MAVLIYTFYMSCEREPEIVFVTKIKTKTISGQPTFATLKKRVNNQKDCHITGNIGENIDLSCIHLAVYTWLMFKDSILILNGVSDFQI